MNNYNEHELELINDFNNYLVTEFAFEEFQLPSFNNYKEECFSVIKINTFAFICFSGERGNIYDLKSFTNIEDTLNYLIDECLLLEEDKPLTKRYKRCV